MVRLEIGENEQNQRLDRYLRKYLKNAPLSYIYKAIREDVKVNGRRRQAGAELKAGDEILLYISDEEIGIFRRKDKKTGVRCSVKTAYEDGNILVAEKPFGLLTYGDRHGEKEHLTNRVIGYLAGKGDYDPETERTFAPSPVNRLDRNTTGLVLFAKNYPALRDLNRLTRERNRIKKFYITIVRGELRQELFLKGKIIKDRKANKVALVPDDEEGLEAETLVRPLETGRGYTLAEVEIVTGRSHQIRIHLAEAGHPVIGDPKYGDKGMNRLMNRKFGLSAQLLHAYRLNFDIDGGGLAYLSGLEVRAEFPELFRRIKDGLLGQNY